MTLLLGFVQPSYSIQGYMSLLEMPKSEPPQSQILAPLLPEVSSRDTNTLRSAWKERKLELYLTDRQTKLTLYML